MSLTATQTSGAAVLTNGESGRLRACEDIVCRGLNTFVEVGEALLEIREDRLYRETHPTFEAYVRERWGFNRHRASQLIGAADVVTTVTSGDVPPPSSERVARELRSIADWPPELQRELWSICVAMWGIRPTAAQTREVVRQFTGIPKTCPAETTAGRIAQLRELDRLINLGHRIACWCAREWLREAIEEGVLIHWAKRHREDDGWLGEMGITPEQADAYLTLATARYVQPDVFDVDEGDLLAPEDALTRARAVVTTVTSELPDRLSDLA